MAFGGLGASGTGPMAEINTTPLVDVMLVLLIIFMVTAPLLTHKITVDLPQTGGDVVPPEPEAVALTVTAEGHYQWNGETLDADALRARCASAAAAIPQPEIQLLADRTATYGQLARALSIAHAAGLARIGFVMQPER